MNIYYSIEDGTNIGRSKVIYYSTTKSFLDDDPVIEKISDILHNIGCRLCCENINEFNGNEEAVITELKKHGYNPIRVPNFD